MDESNGVPVTKGGVLRLDAAGNAYALALTNSADMPTASPVQASIGGGTCGTAPNTFPCGDAFVAKVNSAGNALIFGTYLGGSSEDAAAGIALDPNGNAYLVGITTSSNFPTTSGAFQPGFAGPGLGPGCGHTGPFDCGDAFVARLANLALPVAVPSPTSLTFTSQLVGTTSAAQTVTLSNGGDAALSISSLVVSGDFAQTNTCGTTVAAGANCTITVTFTPTATGSKTGSLTLVHSARGSPHTVNLSGTGIAPAVSLSSTSLSFADQRVGTTTATQSVMLTNSGTATLNISAIAATGDFAQTNTCGTSVAAGANCTLSVTFTPTATGSKTGSVTITSDASGSPQTISLTGTGTAPAVSLSSTSLTFAEQRVGTTSAAQTLTLTNSGTATLNISSLAVSGDFAQTNSCGSSVAAGANCTVNVTFTPTTTGTRPGAITIIDDASGSPHQVVLAGTGGAPAVSVSLSLTFPNQNVGTTSAAQTVTVTNSGTAALNVASVAVSGDFVQTNNCVGSVAAGANCPINITFTPTTTGTRTGGITITDDAAGSPHGVSISGKGVVPAVSLSTTTLAFAGNPLNLDCPEKTATLTNTGDGQLTISGIIPSSEFSQTNTCGTGRDPGTDCVISVKFHPTAVGIKAGTLTITSDAAGSPHTVAVTGNGTPPCALITSTKSATVVRGTDSASFGISDSKPSCSPAAIELSCSINNPASCLFSPARIPPSGNSTLRVGNLPAVSADSLNFIVTGRSEFRLASLPLTVLISDFSFVTYPPAATVTAGQSVTYALTLQPIHGLTGTVQLGCSGAPTGASCAVTPAAVTLDGVTPVQATVTVTTAARAMGAPHAGMKLVPPGGGVGAQRAVPLQVLWVLALLMLLATVAAVYLSRFRADDRRIRLSGLVLGAMLLVTLGWAACGGGGFVSSSRSSGTAAGTYTLTITGTYTATTSDPARLTNNTTLTLVVN